jgi:hypothetical protein
MGEAKRKGRTHDERKAWAVEHAANARREREAAQERAAAARVANRKAAAERMTEIAKVEHTAVVAPRAGTASVGKRTRLGMGPLGAIFALAAGMMAGQFVNEPRRFGPDGKVLK